MNFHLHKFKLESTMKGGHKHNINGHVEHMIGLGNFHFHYYAGVSAYTNHTHYFSGMTGLPVKTENGHIHKINGLLESNNMHEHKYNGHTSEEVSYISGKTFSESYI